MTSSNKQIEALFSGSPDKVSIDEIPQLVQVCLREFLSERRKEVEAIDPHVAAATAMLDEIVLGGGKRMRPMFAWVGFLGAGGLSHEPSESVEAVIRAVSALELIQACALIHDDIIDASDTRRGAPTVHRRVERIHEDKNWRGSASKFGEAIGILVGDLALSWAEDMIQNSGLSSAALERVRVPWQAMKTEVIAGQILDISVESSGDERAEAAEKINRYKTAAYTIERPLHLGAAIADGSASVVEAYREFGHDIGIAYQLMDDLLGVFGDPQETGKPAGDDLREGKRTVLMAEALRLADVDRPQDATLLRAKLGETDNPEELLELAEIIRSLGAPAKVEERISDLTSSGIRHLDEVTLEADAKTTLIQLAERATNRRV